MVEIRKFDQAGKRLTCRLTVAHGTRVRSTLAVRFMQGWEVDDDDVAPHRLCSTAMLAISANEATCHPRRGPRSHISWSALTWYYVGKISRHVRGQRVTSAGQLDVVTLGLKYCAYRAVRRV